MTGRTRPSGVDALGRRLGVVVHAAAHSDTAGARDGGAKVRGRFPRVQHSWADQGYKATMIAWFRQWLPLVVEVGTRSAEQRGGDVQPQRWLVERTFGWFNRQRQWSRAYDVYAETTEQWM